MPNFYKDVLAPNISQTDQGIKVLREVPPCDGEIMTAACEPVSTANMLIALQHDPSGEFKTLFGRSNTESKRFLNRLIKELIKLMNAQIDENKPKPGTCEEDFLRGLKQFLEARELKFTKKTKTCQNLKSKGAKAKAELINWIKEQLLSGAKLIADVGFYQTNKDDYEYRESHAVNLVGFNERGQETKFFLHNPDQDPKSKSPGRETITLSKLMNKPLRDGDAKLDPKKHFKVNGIKIFTGEGADTAVLEKVFAFKFQPIK